jgi:hypothetical protein
MRPNAEQNINRSSFLQQSLAIAHHYGGCDVPVLARASLRTYGLNL